MDSYEGSAEHRVRQAVAALVADDGQEAVAEAIGVRQPTVSRYLMGRTALTLQLMVGLARAYPELRPLLDRVLDGQSDADPASVAAS